MTEENDFAEQGNISEQLPPREEIKSVFENILQCREHTEMRVLSNEGGVYRYEIEVVLENGARVLYFCQKADRNYRDKSLPESAQCSATIYSITFNDEGIPDGGDTLANYRDGKWEHVS